MSHAGKWHVMPQRIVSIAIALSLAAAPLATAPRMAQAASSDEIQAQLNEAQAVLDELTYSMWVAESDLGKANYDLDMTRVAIDDLNVQIADNKEVLAQKQDSLSRQVHESYKNGPVALLDVVLSSTTFDDFVTRLFYANRISNQFVRSIDEVKDLREQLAAQEAELEQREEELVEQVAAQEESLAAMEVIQAQQAAYIDQLSEELKEAIEEERRRAAEEARKAAEEAARKEAEEAARREAEEQAAREAEEAARAAEEAAEAAEQVAEEAGISYQPSIATSDQRSIAVNAALSQVGVAYIWSAQTPGVGFDCNGLTNWAWAQAGVSIPYTSGHYSYGQFQWLKESGHWVTSAGALQLGDLVFYSWDGGYSCYHVAMYIGDGMVVHAIDYSHGVAVTPLDWCSGFCGGGSPI